MCAFEFGESVDLFVGEYAINNRLTYRQGIIHSLEEMILQDRSLGANNWNVLERHHMFHDLLSGFMLNHFGSGVQINSLPSWII